MTGVAAYLEESKQGNTRRKLLKEQLMLQDYNLFSYSKNLRLLDPKSGCEKQWEDALEKVRLLTQMYEELPNEHGVKDQIKTEGSVLVKAKVKKAVIYHLEWIN